VAGSELQRAVGIALAIYGFFMAAFPDRYTLPLITLVFSPGLSPSVNSSIGFFLLVLGAYLFVRKKPLVEL